MKSVLISIRPEWVAKILSGEKTIEVRKTHPTKIETPFKCFIYCTKAKIKDEDFLIVSPNFLYYASGKIIGEFKCDYILWQHLGELRISEDFENGMRGSCLTRSELYSYLKYPRGTSFLENYKKWEFYTWHIFDLKIYDKPKELRYFGLKRPPQSWCYVKEKSNE